MTSISKQQGQSDIGLREQLDSFFMDPAQVELVSELEDLASQALSRRFVSVIEGDGYGPNVAITFEGDLTHTSMPPFMASEGEALLREQAENRLKEFGPGPAYCKVAIIPNEGAPLWQHHLVTGQGYGLSLQSPETELGGGYEDTGWYRVVEKRYESIGDMVAAVSYYGNSDAEAQNPATLRAALVDVALNYAYQK